MTKKELIRLISDQLPNSVDENLKAFEKSLNEYNSHSRKLENVQRLQHYQNKLFDNDTFHFVSNEEEIKHDLFVKYCLSPDGYKTRHGEVFACVIGTEKNEEDNFVNISVVTPSMAYIDNRYFVSGSPDEDHIWWKEYRPYYYEFTAVFSNEELKRFNSQIENLKCANDYNNHKRWCFWFKAKLVVEKGKEPYGYKGILNFGGSSSFSDELVITSFDTVSKEACKMLNATYKIQVNANNAACSNYLDKYFGISSQYKVKIINVGQANCIYIEDKNSTKRFFFDLGRPSDAYSVRGKKHKIINPDLKPGSNVSNNLNALKHFSHDFIIVSHWHLDHFAAYKDLYRHGVSSTWILPEINIKYDIKSANRLVNYLFLNKARVYYLNLVGRLYNNNGVQILSSTCARKSNPNTRSLILRIKDTVFSADCLYEFWPDDLKNYLSDAKRLVVPHHCSKKNINKRGISDSHRIINSFSKDSGKEAYISVGFNVYHHPNPDHIAELGKALFNIYFTKNVNDYYEFDIS